VRDYGKVYSTFWSSQTTGGMSDDAKLLALYLVTCSHSTIAGVFRLPDGYVSEDLGWVPERVRQGFGELFSKGFANRCETTKWVWVCKHLEWNKPENPNQRKSAAKIASGIPPECSWKRAFMRACGESLGFGPVLGDDPCETVAEGFRNQEQKQEQEQDTSGEGDKSPAELTKTELWAAGKSLLAAHGVPKAQCGSVVGKLVKQYGDQIVVEAVRAAVVAQPPDPIEYLNGTCQRMAGKRASNKPGAQQRVFDQSDYQEYPDGEIPA
jgi:hypothetical protein